MTPPSELEQRRLQLPVPRNAWSAALVRRITAHLGAHAMQGICGLWSSADCIHYVGVVLNSLFPKWPISREKKFLSRNFRGTIAVHDSDNRLI